MFGEPRTFGKIEYSTLDYELKAYEKCSTATLEEEKCTEEQIK